jgi:hypothetical protein
MGAGVFAEASLEWLGCMWLGGVVLSNKDCMLASLGPNQYLSGCKRIWVAVKVAPTVHADVTELERTMPLCY